MALNYETPKPAKKLQSAVKWAFVMNWGPNAIATFLTFVLAAYLGPHDYGVVALALLYISFVQMFLEGGLGAAIVQRQNLDPEHLDAVFWITVAFSVGLTILTWFFSPFWAEFNHTPELRMVLNIEALTLPLQGLTVVQESLLEKKLDFKSLAIRSNISTLIGGVFGLGLAVKGFGVWSLVWDDVLAAVIRVVLLWRLGDWRPALRFSYRHIKDLLLFSFYVLIAQIGTFVQRRSDVILIGYFFNPTAVGIYRLADRLINVVIDMATRPFVLVVLPHFSTLQHNMVELRKEVLRCVRTSTILTLPMLAILSGTAFLICSALSAHGQNWRQADHVIQILALVGAARAVTLFAGPLMQAVNRPREFMWMTWMLAGLNIVSFCIAGVLLRNYDNVEEQAIGVAAMRAAVFCLIYTPICMYVINRLCNAGWSHIVKSLMPGLITGIIVATAGGLLTAALVYVDDKTSFISWLDHHLHVTLPSGLIKLVRLSIGGGVTTALALALMIYLDPAVRNMVMGRLGKYRKAAAPLTVAVEGMNGSAIDADGESIDRTLSAAETPLPDGANK